MATIKALIRATKGKDTAFVRFRLSDGRNVQLFYKSTISVNVILWDSKKGEISTRKICNNTYRRTTNNEIQNTKDRLFEVYEQNKDFIKNSHDLTRAMNGEVFCDLCTDGGNIYDICEVIKQYVKANEMSKRSKEYYKALRTILKHLKMNEQAQGKTTHFADIRTLTANDIANFEDFLKHEQEEVAKHPEIYESKPFEDLTRKGRPPKQRSINTIIGYMKKFRAVLNFAERKGLINKSPMASIKINPEIYGTPYYLTREERDKLTEYDLQDFPELAKIRDLFIFQCFCGCRISDLLRLTQRNIIGNYLEYIPQKTISKRGRVLRIPLHSVALRIIEKYKDNENLLPNCGSTERINRKLKKLFALCGFTRQVQVLNPITRKEEQKQLCEVVSTHMARRTFIGLLYKQVKDPNLIASMSGHAQNSTAFARYRAIDDEIKSEVIRLL